MREPINDDSDELGRRSPLARHHREVIVAEVIVALKFVELRILLRGNHTLE
jgi:hypothetical protein